jgi:eukaryotic-like serine/threonine-protein kinase
MAIESAARGGSPRGRAFGARLARESKALAASTGNPHAIALSILADGFIAVTLGQWKSVAAHGERALAILRDQCVGATWEINIAQNLTLWGLLYQGELGELSRRLPTLLANARSSGNWYVATELCTRSGSVWLAADEPDEGERVTLEAIGRWSHSGFHRQHYSATLSRIQIALYRGDGEAAWRLLDDLESILRQTYLRRVQIMRIESLFLRGRSALAMACVNRGSRRFRAVARSCARRIARERMPWSDPMALLLRAGIAFLESDTPLAVRHLHDAADRFERADMRLHAAAARRRIGVLQHDAAGRELRRQADDWMARQQIKNPAAMTRMWAPGFPDVPEYSVNSSPHLDGL